MKDKLIIIQGAKPLYSNNKIIQKLILFIYRYFFNFIPPYFDKSLWTGIFSEEKYDILEFKWRGKIIPYDVLKTSRELSEIIKLNSKQNIIFFTESIAAEIVLSAIEKSKSKNIKKLISVCPVNKPRKIKDFSMIILKSDSDILERFANFIFWPFYFFKSMDGNINIIKLKNLRHDQFFVPNFQISNDRKLLDLVNSKL